MQEILNKYCVLHLIWKWKCRTPELLLFHIFWWMGKKKHFLVQKVLILNNNIVLCYLQTFWPVGLDYSETFKNMDISKKIGVTEILVEFSFWLRKVLQVSYSPNKLQYSDFMNVKFTPPKVFLRPAASIL